MAKRVQIRGLTTAQLTSNIGRLKELIVDITKKTLTVHDGATAGGIPLAREDLNNVSAATNAVDGKMTAALVQQIEANQTAIAAHEASANAHDAAEINFDNAGTAITGTKVQTALVELDTDLTTEVNARTAHGNNTSNPHSVTAAQAGALAIAENLADLDNSTTAVTNLGLDAEADAAYTAGTSTNQQATSPAKIRETTRSYLNREAGEIVVLGYVASVPGLVRCSGQALSRTTYARLFGKIGTTWGAGDGSTTFNVPNLVKKFVLGADDADTDFDIASTGGAFEITQTGAQVGSHGHKYIHNTTTENQAAAGNGGTLVTKTPGQAGASVVRDAHADEPSEAVGEGIGYNQAQAAVDPMDITNPFVAMPVYMTTGGV